MTDLIQRLLALAGRIDVGDVGSDDEPTTAAALREAADALEVLTKNQNDALRDFSDLKAKLAEAEAQRGRDQYALMVNAHDIDEARAEIERLLKELDWMKSVAVNEREKRWEECSEARAEAAALREALVEISRCGNGDGCRMMASRALSQPGPGAALLERVKKLEAVAERADGVIERRYNLTDLQDALAALDAPCG